MAMQRPMTMAEDASTSTPEGAGLIVLLTAQAAVWLAVGLTVGYFLWH